MNVSFSLATEGIKAALDQQAMVAQRVAKLASDPMSTDLASESMQMIKNQHAMSANVKVAQTADQMLGTLIDMVA